MGEDPFTAMQKEKKAKTKSNKDRELANVKNTLKKVGKNAVPSALKLAASLPEHGRGKPVKRKDLKDDVSSPIVFKMSQDFKNTSPPFEFLK